MRYSNSRVLPTQIYSPAQIKLNEGKAAKTANLSLYDLMQRAGQAVFELVSVSQIKPAKLCVAVGKGNNAGDGFVVAKLALTAGWQVCIATMPNCDHDSDHWQGDALTAKQALDQTQPPDHAELTGNQSTHNSNALNWQAADELDFSQFDIVVDAMIGTGLKKNLTSNWQAIIQKINQQAKAIISIDAPTGLNTETGEVLGEAIHANQTVTFIGLKSGLFTADAADYVGRLFFAGLSVDTIFAQQNRAYYNLVDINQLKSHLSPRKRNSHKGSFGHLVCIGGDKGMSGAIKLSAEAALRTGAGLVSVYTHPENVAVVSANRPELMVSGVSSQLSDVKQAIQNASAIVIGPGLGQSSWASRLMTLVLEAECPVVVDADGLNWLSEQGTQKKYPTKKQNWVLTPHPAEAARLLKLSTSNIQANRYAAAIEIQANYGGAVILKGSGSVIANYHAVSVCRQGNPGMASGGMGDLLTGIVGALLAQGIELNLAAELATCIHASAGDLAAEQGERGLLASDLLPCIKTLVNQAM